MLHEPATPAGKDPAAPYKMRLGVWMFVVYAFFYAGFVAINLLGPLAMGDHRLCWAEPGDRLRLRADHRGADRSPDL